MEDVLKFLLIAAVIVIGIVRQLKKEANKNADKAPTMPVPETENPLPGNWGGGTYGGYIPEGPQQEPVIKVEKKKTAPKPFLSNSYVPLGPEGTSSYNKTPSINPNISPPVPEVQENDDSEFAIHSAEEARRAIIWSEILQRKY